MHKLNKHVNELQYDWFYEKDIKSNKIIAICESESLSAEGNNMSELIETIKEIEESYNDSL